MNPVNIAVGNIIYNTVEIRFNWHCSASGCIVANDGKYHVNIGKKPREHMLVDGININDYQSWVAENGELRQ